MLELTQGDYMKKLFGKKDIVPSCSYCVHGRIAPDKESVLCKKSGLTDLDYSCKKFKYDPLKRQPRRPKPIAKFDEENFSLDVENENMNENENILQETFSEADFSLDVDNETE